MSNGGKVEGSYWNNFHFLRKRKGGLHSWGIFSSLSSSLGTACHTAARSHRACSHHADCSHGDRAPTSTSHSEMPLSLQEGSSCALQTHLPYHCRQTLASTSPGGHWAALLVVRSQLLTGKSFELASVSAYSNSSFHPPWHTAGLLHVYHQSPLTSCITSEVRAGHRQSVRPLLAPHQDKLQAGQCLLLPSQADS